MTKTEMKDLFFVLFCFFCDSNEVLILNPELNSYSPPSQALWTIGFLTLRSAPNNLDQNAWILQISGFQEKAERWRGTCLLALRKSSVKQLISPQWSLVGQEARCWGKFLLVETKRMMTYMSPNKQIYEP